MMKTSKFLLTLIFVIAGFICSQVWAADQIAIVGSGDNGRVELFYARDGSTPGIFHTYQTAPGVAGPFHPWVQMSSTLQGPAAIVAQRDKAGRIVVGWLDSGSIVVSQAASAGGAQPSGMKLTISPANSAGRAALESRLRSLLIAQDEDGRSEFFAINNEYQVWSIAQTTAGTWATLNNHNLGGRGIVQIAAAPFRDGRLALVALSGGSVQWRSQTGPNNNWVPDWLPLGGSNLRAIAAQTNQNGTLQIAAIGGDGKLYGIKQNLDWTWSTWSVIAGPGIFGTRLSMAQNQDGRLEVFVDGQSGGLYHFWQNPDGSWNPAGHTGDLIYPSGANFSVTKLPSGDLAMSTADSLLCQSLTSQQGLPGGDWQSLAPASNWKALPTIGTFCAPTMQITSFYASPSSIVAGESSTLNWNYKATGSCTSINLLATDNGNSVFNQAATGSFFSFPVKVTAAGKYTFNLKATCTATSVSDSKSTSLTVSASPPPPSSNLVFANGPFYPGAQPAMSIPFQAQMLILNAGSGSSQPDTINMYVDNMAPDAQSTPQDSQSLKGLPAGQSTLVTFNVPPQTDDVHTLTFVIQHANLQSPTYNVATF
jgi:hypothetical protein